MLFAFAATLKFDFGSLFESLQRGASACSNDEVSVY